MKKLFGTDGVRGLANAHPMTPEIAMALGQSIAAYFNYAKSTHRVIIGKDTRRSSYMIEQAIAAGVCSMGSNAVLTGPVPTPAVAFLTKALRADAGVMISASHNPFSDNGVKFFDRDGYKLNDADELKIESFIENDLPKLPRPTGSGIGKAFRVDDVQGRYIEFVKTSFPRDLSLDGLKIVIDCANGAAYKIAPSILWELGAEVICLGVAPNGTNINAGCGAMHPESLAREVALNGAHIGLALDGDADRLVICDEQGQIIDGDRLIALCALQMKTDGRLHVSQIVGTVLTNMGVEVFLRDNGIELVRTPVGDRYIIEKMRQSGANLGGEPSGHVIFSNHTTTGDGLIAALQVLAAVVRTGKSLSALVASIPLFPQSAKNVKVRERKPLESVPEISKAITDLQTRMAGRGRAVVRYSGTEQVLRVMIEGESREKVDAEMQKIITVIEAHLS